MDTLGFLENLYGLDPPGYVVLWTRQDKKSKWYEAASLKSAAIAAQKMAKDKDVYFGISLQDKDAAVALAQKNEDTKSDKPKKIGTEQTRGFMETTLACPGVWLDLDIQGPAHKTDKLPASLEEALDLIKEFPIEATFLVHSGHGLQAWWLFKEPWIFETPQERQECADLVKRFQVTMQEKAKKHVWEIDSTFDLARVLRLPGTFNRKLEPEPVRVIHESHNRYNPYDFEDYLIDVSYLSQGINSKEKVNPVSVLAGVPSGQRDITLFKYACRLRAKGMAIEEAETLVLQAAANCAPPFPVEDAREKVRSAWKYQSGTENERVLDGLVDRPDDVFQPEVLSALAQLKRQNMGEYARIKQQLKGKVNLNDFERAVKDQGIKDSKLRIVDTAEPLPLLEEILPDWPLKEMRKPFNWSINENGIWRHDLKFGDICACAVPTVLKQRLKNIETGEEKMELGYYRDGKWHYITAKRSVVFNRNSLVQLGDKGLPVSSETAKELVKYYSDVERENLTLLPVVRAVDHFGWVGGGFMPGAVKDVVLDVEDGTGSMAVAYGYRPEGDLEEWVGMVGPIRKYPVARFILAASFAAPLMKLLNQRVFFVHSWGQSRGGKTSALKAALSVWGCPEDTMVSFNATKVGLERIAAFYQDLPLGVDERQVVGDKQGVIDSLVYMLGTGRGKTRGSKGGGLQQFNQWRSIILTTGEEPLTAASSTAGIGTRVIEVYGAPIPDEELGAKLHQVTKDQFGTAGPVFINQLISELKEDSGLVRDLCQAIEEKLKEWHGEKIASHRAAIALIVAGDYFASQWIFGLEDQQEAMEEAISMAEVILTQLDNAKDASDSSRAYEYFLSWYGVNSSFFGVHPPGGVSYGFFENDVVYVYPSIFEKAMKEGGYNARRILRDWAEEGLIQTEVRTGENKRRFKVRKYDQRLNRTALFAAVMLPVYAPSGHSGH